MSEINISSSAALLNQRQLRAANNAIGALMENVTRVEAVCHTVEMHFPAMLPPLDELRFAQWGQWIKYEECERKDGSVWGHRLFVNAPCRAAFAALDDLKYEAKATVSRFDLAINYFAASQASLDALAAYFARHGILLWNRGRGTHTEQNGVYLVNLTGREGRQTPRGVVIYADNPKYGCHVEFRVLGTPSARRQGIVMPSDILALNPAAFVKRNFRVVEPFEEQRDDLILRLKRQAVADDRRSAVIEPRGATPSFRERYRSDITRRIECYVRRLAPNDRAQEYHRYFKLPMTPVDLAILRVPAVLNSD